MNNPLVIRSNWTRGVVSLAALALGACGLEDGGGGEASRIAMALSVPETDAAAPVPTFNQQTLDGCAHRVSSSSAIISNGTIQMGINDEGHLNMAGGTLSSGRSGTTNVGLRFVPTNGESTAPGCLCEGWGVADAVSGVEGHASVDTGPTFNVVVESFTSTASTARSIVRIANMFRVSHEYTPRIDTPYLYNVEVIIENISPYTVEDLRYTRGMDWDIPPNTFSEYVTIQGTAANGNVLLANDNGFQTVNPLASRGDLLGRGDFVDLGPADHGAHFDLGFGALEPGKTKTFKIFYGAAPDEASALAALSQVGASFYSLGQANWDGTGDPLSPAGVPPGTYGKEVGAPATFMFAFAEVDSCPTVDPLNGSFLGDIGRYSVYSFGSYTGARHVEGAMAAAGDITCANGFMSCDVASVPNAIVSGGLVTLSSGTVHGNLVTTMPASLASSVTFASGAPTVVGALPTSFVANQAQVQGLSDDLKASPTNGLVNVKPWGEIFMKGANPKYDVFQISAAELAGSHRLNIDVPGGATAVINVTGIDVYFGGGFDLTGISPQRVLFNFYDATAIHIEGTAFKGSAIAPKAAVHFHNGEFYGHFAAASFEGDGVFRWLPFNGQLCVAYDVPVLGTCKAEYDVTNSWPGNFQASVKVTNLGAPIHGWTIGLTFANGESVSSLWNGNFIQTGANLQVTDVGWNAQIPNGESVDFGCIAAGIPGMPSAITLNGVNCDII